ncbi:hypothetical protein CPB86DRAFT_790956, partial [Serendipita vermifera]
MLHTIFQAIRVHLPGERLQEQAQTSSLSLPLEIWWIILEMASDYGPILMGDFYPCDIVAALAYFSDQSPHTSAQIVARGLAARWRKFLKQVCRSWKHIIDNIGI